MIPLRDTNPTSTRPVVTITLIALNCVAFLFELSLGEEGMGRLFMVAGMIPEKVAIFPVDPNVTLLGAFLPFFSSMFLHGGFMHLIGNMWFLWIFGDNIEDHLSHLRYLGFYLLCGLGAGLTHLAFNWGSNIPTIGASGAVAGVLGGYLLLYPRHKVLTLIPFFFLLMIELPAAVILIYWFVIQFFSGAATTLGGAGGAGVAWWAHVGGFILGVLLIFLFGQQQSPPRAQYRFVN